VSLFRCTTNELICWKVRAFAFYCGCVRHGPAPFCWLAVSGPGGACCWTPCIKTAIDFSFPSF